MSTNDFVDHSLDSDLPSSAPPMVDIGTGAESLQPQRVPRRIELPRISIPPLPAIDWKSIPWKSAGGAAAVLIIATAVWSWKPWQGVQSNPQTNVPTSQSTTQQVPEPVVTTPQATAPKSAAVPPPAVAAAPSLAPPPPPEVDPVPMDVTAGTCALGFSTVDRYYKARATRTLSLGEQGWIRFGFSCVGRGYLSGTAEGFALPAPAVRSAQAPAPAKAEETKASISTTRHPSQSTKPQVVPEHYPLTKETCAAHADDFDRLGDSATTNAGDRALRELRRGCLTLQLVPPTATVSATASTCALSGVLVPDDGQALTDLHGVVEIRSVGYRHDSAVQSDGTFTATDVPASASLSLAVRVSHLRDTSVQVQGCPGQVRVAVRHSDVAGAITDRLTGIFHRGSH